MTVSFTAGAETDLEEIGDHIARDDPARALSFVRELRARCGELAASPRLYPVVPRYERFGLRRRLQGRYLIFYRENERGVLVVRILHGTRDYRAILLDEERDDGA